MTTNLKRRSLLTLAAALAAPQARAAEYPTRPVRVIVPFAPAGPTDIMARILTNYLGSRLNGSFIVDNRPGAGGNIGTAFVARAEPDGYTLLIDSSAFVVNPSLYKRCPYDAFTDFAPISELGTSPNVFVAGPQTGIASIGDLIAKCKADPTAISYANPGIGTTPQLSGELLKLKAGISMTSVPFGGAGPAVQAVLGGTTPVACVALPPARPLIASNSLRALAVTGSARWFDLPDVPTMVELGYPEFVADTFQAFLAPAKTPPEIVALLAKTSLDILHDKAVAEQLHGAGLEVVASTPEAFVKRIAADVPKWRDIIRDAKIPQV
ncbi:MAG: tripartite tricarboxylate transporter substrate binding protein [Acetobacteraceae bacterium]|nr:tripartite tricarboxylate transporter substrate binding protein [Acetobacteraceae bacterium]